MRFYVGVIRESTSILISFASNVLVLSCDLKISEIQNLHTHKEAHSTLEILNYEVFWLADVARRLSM